MIKPPQPPADVPSSPQISGVEMPLANGASRHVLPVLGLSLILLSGCGSESEGDGVEGSGVRQAALAGSSNVAYQLLVRNDDGIVNAYAVSDTTLASIPAEHYDASANTLTRGADQWVFFMGSSGVQGLDLRGKTHQSPMALNGPGGACRVLAATSLDSSGNSALLTLASLQDGSCGSTPSHLLQVGANGAVVTIALVNERLIQPVKNADGGVAGLLMAVKVNGGGEWVAWRAVGSSAAPTLLGEVPASVSTSVEWLGQDASQPGLGYLKLNGQLRSLRWSGQQLSLDTAVLHSFASSDASAFAGDAQGVYFSDGLSLLRARAGVVAALGTLGDDTADLGVEKLVLTTQRVAAMLTTPARTDLPLGCVNHTRLLQSLGRAGGSPVSLRKEAVDTCGVVGGVPTMFLGWGSGDQIVLKQSWTNTTSHSSGHLLAVQSDAQAPTSPVTFDSSRNLLLPVLPATIAHGSTAVQPSALIAFDSNAQALVQLSLPGLVSQSLGALPRSTSFNNETSCTQAIAQVPVACTVPMFQLDSDAQEAWRFTPGQNSSLQQIVAR
ncbi:hypothetical protein [Ideonella livida]|uniref:Uncharacterized protein n=1 Tax=Ideonella livida TaxID=2707176 RepID=A0A7C9PGK3_9BURK|nr:hypothetical protein [Ideonella livida]NDY90474.1 hypothetical protein [Ideonella livida]